MVMDKNNSKNSPIVTVIPLTSVKKTTDLSKLHPGNIYLGNELFRSLSAKISSVDTEARNHLQELEAQIKALSDSVPTETLIFLNKEIKKTKV